MYCLSSFTQKLANPLFPPHQLKVIIHKYKEILEHRKLICKIQIKSLEMFTQFLMIGLF